MKNLQGREYLGNKPVKILKKIKGNIKQVDAILQSYLFELPIINTTMKSGGGCYFPCSTWVNGLIDYIDEHCMHCIHKPSSTCKHECLDIYKMQLMRFCSLCERQSDSCLRRMSREIEMALNGKPAGEANYPGQYVFTSSCNFVRKMSERTDFTIATYIIPRLPIKISTSEFYAYERNLVQRIERFCNMILYTNLPSLDNIGKRRVYEIGLTILSVNIMLIRDLYNGTVFFSSENREVTFNEAANREMGNILEKGIQRMNGRSSASIRKELNENIDPGTIHIGFQTTHSACENFSTDKLIEMMDKISEIYQHPALPTITERDIPDTLETIFKEHFSGDRLQVDNYDFTSPGVQFDDRVAAPYIYYCIFKRMIALVKAVRNTRFTKKIPKLFEGNHLFVLRQKLEERETLKEACDDMGFKIQTVCMAIEAYKKKHPAHERISDPKREDYGRKARYITEVTTEELREWQRRVQSLKL